MTARHSKNIALTAQLDSWVDALVDSGEYKSASEVMRDALRTLKERRDREAATLAALRQTIRTGEAEAEQGAFAAGTGADAVHRAFALPTDE